MLLHSLVFRVQKDLGLNSGLGMVAYACQVSAQRPKQEEYCGFKVNLGYIVRFCPPKEKKMEVELWGRMTRFDK